MPLSNVLRLDRFQQAVFDALSDSLGSGVDVGWAYGQAAFEQRGADLVDLTMANGPSQWTRKRMRGRPLLPFDDITIKVSAAVLDMRNIVRINDFAFFTDVLLGESPEDVRDALVTAINADSDNDPWTAAPAIAVDELVITPAAFGSIFSLELVGDLTAPSQTISGNAGLLTRGTRVFTIQIQCFSKGREPRNGAWNLMGNVLATFEAEEYIEAMRALGVSVWDKGIATDISAIAGANWESRVTVDVQMTMQSVFVRPVEAIETVEIDFTALNSEGLVIGTETTIISAP